MPIKINNVKITQEDLRKLMDKDQFPKSLKKDLFFDLVEEGGFSQLITINGGLPTQATVKTIAKLVTIPANYQRVIDGVLQTVTYYENEVPDDRNPNVLLNNPSHIAIRKGQVRIRKENMELAWFMMHNPKNQSNPDYLLDDGSLSDEHIGKRFTFRENDPDKKEATKAAANRFFGKAIAKLEATKPERLKQFYQSRAGHDTEANDTKIYNYFMDMIKTEPDEFMKYFDDELVEIAVLINAAKKRGIITYHTQHRKWMWAKEGDNSVICLLAKGQDEIQGFAKYIRMNDPDGTLVEALKKGTIE